MSERTYNKIKAATVALINHPNNGEMGFLKQRFLNHVDMDAQDIEVTFDHDDMNVVEVIITTTMYDDVPAGTAVLHHDIVFDTTEKAKQEFLTALTEAVQHLIVMNGPRPNIPFIKLVGSQGYEVDQYTYSNFGIVMTPELEQLHVVDGEFGGIAANDD